MEVLSYHRLTGVWETGVRGSPSCWGVWGDIDVASPEVVSASFAL